MISLGLKDYNMIVTEKQQKYQHYHLGKLINMNILKMKKICLLKFTYSPLEKAFEKQTIEEQRRIQIGAIANQKQNFFLKKSGEIKLKEKKNLQNLFKLNLNEIPRGRHRSEEQKSALENNKLVYESRDVFIKLSNDYSSIAFDPKYETVNRKGIPSMSAHVAQGRVPKVSNHSKFKISNLKKCFKNYQ